MLPSLLSSLFLALIYYVLVIIPTTRSMARVSEVCPDSQRASTQTITMMMRMMMMTMMMMTMNNMNMNINMNMHINMNVIMIVKMVLLFVPWGRDILILCKPDKKPYLQHVYLFPGGGRCYILYKRPQRTPSRVW